MDDGGGFEDGGGDTSPPAPAPQWRVRFGHGQRHLRGTGLTVAEVHATIIEHLVDGLGRATHVGESVFGRVVVRGHVIEYRARRLGDGDINVGTYYPVT